MTTDNNDDYLERAAHRNVSVAEIVDFQIKSLEQEPTDASIAVSAMEAEVQHARVANWATSSNLIGNTGNFTVTEQTNVQIDPIVEVKVQETVLDASVQSARDKVNDSFATQEAVPVIQQIAELDKSNFALGA